MFSCFCFSGSPPPPAWAIDYDEEALVLSEKSPNRTSNNKKQNVHKEDVGPGVVDHWMDSAGAVVMVSRVLSPSAEGSLKLNPFFIQGLDDEVADPAGTPPTGTPTFSEARSIIIPISFSMMDSDVSTDARPSPLNQHPPQAEEEGLTSADAITFKATSPEGGPSLFPESQGIPSPSASAPANPPPPPQARKDVPRLSLSRLAPQEGQQQRQISHPSRSGFNLPPPHSARGSAGNLSGRPQPQVGRPGLQQPNQEPLSARHHQARPSPRGGGGQGILDEVTGFYRPSPRQQKLPPQPVGGVVVAKRQPNRASSQRMAAAPPPPKQQQRVTGSSRMPSDFSALSMSGVMYPLGSYGCARESYGSMMSDSSRISNIDFRPRWR